MLELRASNNDVVEPYVHKFPNAQFFAGKKPWEVKVDIAMPCATQNELDGEDAKKLLANGVKIVAEVSNMGCRPEAIDAFIAAKIPYGPGKAVNAGGVATSGLEMSQNSQKFNWTAEEVDAKLHQIMSSIHHACLEYGTEKDGFINYMKGRQHRGLHEGRQVDGRAGHPVDRRIQFNKEERTTSPLFFIKSAHFLSPPASVSL